MFCAYISRMTVHLAETDTKLSEVIDRALKGEEVVVTRNGQPVARINGFPAREPKPISDASIDWLERNRIGMKPLKEDSGTLLRRIRDEEPE
jgi:prevent-host-death family protein